MIFYCANSKLDLCFGFAMRSGIAEEELNGLREECIDRTKRIATFE